MLKLIDEVEEKAYEPVVGSIAYIDPIIYPLDLLYG